MIKVKGLLEALAANKELSANSIRLLLLLLTDEFMLIESESRCRGALRVNWIKSKLGIEVEELQAAFDQLISTDIVKLSASDDSFTLSFNKIKSPKVSPEIVLKPREATDIQLGSNSYLTGGKLAPTGHKLLSLPLDNLEEGKPIVGSSDDLPPGLPSVSPDLTPAEEIKKIRNSWGIATQANWDDYVSRMNSVRQRRCKDSMLLNLAKAIDKIHRDFGDDATAYGIEQAAKGNDGKFPVENSNFIRACAKTRARSDHATPEQVVQSNGAQKKSQSKGSKYEGRA